MSPTLACLRPIVLGTAVRHAFTGGLGVAGGGGGGGEECSNLFTVAKLPYQLCCSELTEPRMTTEGGR